VDVSQDKLRAELKPCSKKVSGAFDLFLPNLTKRLH